MTVFRRGKVYWTRIYGERMSLETESRTVALAREAELRDIAERERLGLEVRNKNPHGLTLAQAVDRHLAGRAAKQAQRSKLAMTLDKHIKRDAIGELRLEKVSRGVVVEWLDRREAAGAAQGTLNNLRANLSSIFSGLIEREVFLGENPVRRVRARKVAQPEPKAVPWEWVLPLFEQAPSTDWQIAMMFIAYAGMRRSEIERAEWEHIDLDGRGIEVQKTKSGRRRVVPLHRDLVAALRDYKRPALRTGQVVNGGIGWGKSAVIVRNALERAGCPDHIRKRCTFHGLRSTWSSRLADAGVEQALIKLIGWGASDVMTRHYMRPSRALVEAIDLLSYEPGKVLEMAVTQSAHRGRK